MCAGKGHPAFIPEIKKRFIYAYQCGIHIGGPENIFHAEPFLEIHPSDARKCGIKDGDLVKVETLRGYVRLKSRVTEDILPGVVNMMHGWEEANANVLTDDEARDPITGYTEFRVNLCRVEKI